MSHVHEETNLDDIPTKREWLGPFVTLLVVFLGYAIMAYTGYTANDKAMAQRITTVETQQKNDGQRLERMEFKLDQVLNAVRDR